MGRIINIQQGVSYSKKFHVKRSFPNFSDILLFKNITFENVFLSHTKYFLSVSYALQLSSFFINLFYRKNVLHRLRLLQYFRCFILYLRKVSRSIGNCLNMIENNGKFNNCFACFQTICEVIVYINSNRLTRQAYLKITIPGNR